MSRSRRLKKYSVHVTKDYDVGDARQIPASGVTVTPYRRGFTASGPATFGSSQTLAVFDVGEVKANDTIMLASDVIAGNSTPTVTVNSIDGPTQITGTLATGASMVVAADDRLVLTNNTPAAFDEPSGASSLASFTTDADGYARGYLEAEGNAVDVLISGGGVDSVMYYDEWLGGAENHIVYADDYASLQDAIDACPDRGTVQMSAKLYEPTATLTIDKTIRLRGEGRGINYFSDSGEAGTTIKQFSVNTTVISCTTDGVGNLTFEDFRLQGQGGTGSGNGIELNAAAAVISSPRFTNVQATGLGHHGFFCDFVDFPLFERCSSLSNGGDGFRFTTACAQVRIFHSYALNNDDFGVYMNTVLGFQIDGIGIQGNHQEPDAGVAKTDDGFPQLMLETCHEGSVQRIDFEDFDSTAFGDPGLPVTAVEMHNCRGVIIAGCGFNNSTATPEVGRGIYISNNNDGICIWGNRFNEIDEAIVFEDLGATSSHNIFIGPNGYTNDVTTAITLPSVANMADQNIVVLDTVGSAATGVPTNARGMLIPIYANANLPTASGCEGSIAYDSTNQTLGFSDGTNWINVNGGGSL